MISESIEMASEMIAIGLFLASLFIWLPMVGGW